MPVVNARGEIYEVDRESRVNAWDFRRVRSYTVIAFSVWRFFFRINLLGLSLSCA